MNSLQPGRVSQPPARWTNRPALVERWLLGYRRECASVQLFGGLLFFLGGLLVLGLTCAFGALFVAFNRASFLFSSRSRDVQLVIFSLVFAALVVLSFVTAWRRRGDSSLRRLTNLGWEFFCAGPIMMIMGVEDLQTFSRLMDMDLVPVAKVLLLAFDHGGRATFAEISLAFPGLNSVRVLPQLRDLPGVNRWTDDGLVSLFDEMRAKLAAALGQSAKAAPEGQQTTGGNPASDQTPNLSHEVLGWYRTLNLPPYASVPEVRKRYKKLVKIHHPDARAAAGTAAEAGSDEQIKRINVAYHNILKWSREHPGFAV